MKQLDMILGVSKNQEYYGMVMLHSFSIGYPMFRQSNVPDRVRAKRGGAWHFRHLCSLFSVDIEWLLLFIFVCKAWC